MFLRPIETGSLRGVLGLTVFNFILRVESELQPYPTSDHARQSFRFM